MSHKKTNLGFTLIELMVVITIISLLSGIVLSALNLSRAKARDARRDSDIHQISLALNLYYADHGNYPGAAWLSSVDTAQWSYLEGILSPYLSKLPVDPVNNTYYPFWGGGKYSYTYASFYPGDYDLVAHYEVSGNPNRYEVKNWVFHSCDPTICPSPWSLYGADNDFFADH